MTTIQLSCFRCLVEEGSVTRAAKRLYVTQPAVSQQLRLLEEGLGCKLYRQRARRIELTLEGEFLYQKAKGILSELDDLPNEVRSYSKQAIGAVRIGSGQVAAKTVVSDTIEDVLQAFPQVSFSLVETGSGNIPGLIQKCRVDIGVGIPVPGIKGIRFEKLLTGRLLLICSTQNPLHNQKSISRRKLRKLSLIRHSTETSARLIDFALYGEDHAASNFQLEAVNSETIISYVRKNMGVALATNYTIDWLKPEGIATVELEENVDIPWGVMSDDSRSLSRAANAFIDSLKQRLAS